MSSAGQDQPTQRQAAALPSRAGTNSAAPPAKRPPADDDVQFVSSNPVKKRRGTERKPSQARAEPQSSPPIAGPSQPPQGDWYQSMGGAGSQQEDPHPTLDNRGVSLPALENFAFPQSLAPAPTRPARLSEAISPKQVPRALPPPRAVHVAGELQNSVGIDLISCLDFNGMATNAPGFDVSGVFFPGSGVLGGLSTSVPTQPSFPPLSSHNAIPFAMYSTGNIVPIPQPNWSRPSAAFTGVSAQGQAQENGGSYGIPQRSGLRQQRLAALNLGASGPIPTPKGLGAETTQTHGRSPSPAPGAKLPCPRCARLRQDNLLRRVQGTPRQPQTAPRPQSPIHRDSSPLASADDFAGHAAAPPPRSTPPSTLTGQEPGQQPLARHVDLVADISQTAQAIFPYAQVAARHCVPQAAVAAMLVSMLHHGARSAPTRPPAPAPLGKR